jgi:sortase A
MVLALLVAVPLVDAEAMATTRPGTKATVHARKARRARVRRSRRPPRTAPTPIGRILIPRIGLDHPIYDGHTLAVIDFGPGHFPSTPMPGEAGNTVFAGHRVTHTHPFLNIDLLEPGDRVEFDTAAGHSVYEVTDHWVVRPQDTWIAQRTTEPSVTFFGCHPKHSARYRYVVRGRLISGPPRAQSQPPPSETTATTTPPPEETTTTTASLWPI